MQSGDSYNRGGFLAFMFSMIFSLCFFFYIALIHPGIDLKEVPEEVKAAQQAVAGETEKAAPAFDASKVTNPWEESEGMIKYGQQVYQNNCAVCHGSSGMGDGPAGKALVPPPRNFVEGKWKVGGDSISLFNTLKNGLPGTSMAAFGHIPKVDRWALVHYIRSITKNKMSDESAKVSKFAETAE